MSDVAAEPVASGVTRLALRTPTLLPATQTNTYLVGERDFLLVEPATPYAEEQSRLHACIDDRIARGHRLVAIVATHHHGDHVGGAAELRARYGAPLVTHRETREKLRGFCDVDALVDDGDTTLGARVGADIEVLHTPGHAPGHVVLHDRTHGWMIAGDMVSSLSTILIDVGDGGDMDAYIVQLRRMSARSPAMLLPAHGDPIAAAVAKLEAYVAHREAREEKVRRAVEGGARELRAIVARAYDDTPAALWPIAEMSARAHLARLESRGKVARVEAGWRATEKS